ncbi:MAG: hypothetical protein NTZ42_03195 [Candidatus Gribaldobacteria bacterium]|nr:hypothetical protein [Candidatus Gribaldobacteria bacterium]
MLAEKEPQPESREKEPIDFVGVFREKLASIKPSESGELKNIRVWNWPSEVKIKREAVALVFRFLDKIDKYELWIDDWQDIRDKSYPHYEAEGNLENFCEQKTEKPQVTYTAFLIENQEGGVWLLVGDDTAKYLEKDINNKDYDEYLNRLLNVCSRYNIEKIIGDFNVEKRDEANIRYTGETREILNQDIIGQIREERHLLDFIEKHRDVLDTNTKILRFRVLAEKAREAAKKQEDNGKALYSLESILEDMEKENGRTIN